LKIPSIRTLRRYHRITEVGDIISRYFALNAFDGVITIVGVLVGGYFGQIKDSDSVLTLGLSTSFAMAVSGFYGAYMSERAERRRELAELEESTLSSLKDTDISYAAIYATIVVAVVNGISPSVAAVIALVPFFFAAYLSIDTAYYAAFGVAFLELFGVGIYLGTVSRERLVLSGFKMLVIGLLIVLVGYLLG
jgi:predicted membrane protein (TIGR00267 family)